MRTVEDIISNQSDEDVLLAYRQLKEMKDKEAIFVLRTAFIENRLYSQENVDWNGPIKEFVIDETNDIKNKRQTIIELTKGYRKVLTRINPFLNAKLVKEGCAEYSFSEIISASSRQNLFMSNTIDKSLFVKVSLGMYLGEDYNSDLNRFMIKLCTKNPALKGLYANYKRRQGFAQVESQVDDVYRRNKDKWNIREQEFDHIREQVLVLFLLNWHLRNMVIAEYYLMKAIRISSREDYITEVLKFLNKELFNNVFVD